MEIRNARVEDIPALYQLLGQVLAVHHEGRPDLFRGEGSKYTPEELEALLKEPARPIFVAVENDCVLGYAFCVLKEIRGNTARLDRKTLYLDDLCVDETIRGRHVGTALMDHIRAYGKEKGCDDLTLNVWVCNEAAMGFYLRNGLKPQRVIMEELLR